MSQTGPGTHAHRRTEMYGAAIFACMVLTCFLEFVFMRRIDAPAWQLALTFALGSLYAALGILDSPIVAHCGQRMRVPVFLFMNVVVTGLIYVSPARGFFGFIVLPLFSIAIFDLSKLWAVLAGLYLFAASLGVFWFHFGFDSMTRTVFSYLAGFAFTAGFSIITKQAVASKETAEQLTQKLEDANAQLRAHAAQTEDLATTRERNRVAREIHDGLGHYLTVVKTQLDAATALLPANPEKARESVTKAAHLTAEALDDVRRSVGSLRTDAARPPLPDALRLLTQEAGLPAAVRVEGLVRLLPPGIEHALFRAAQEGLTNIRKHAAASAAEVALDFRDAGRVTLAVTDNGRGANGVATVAGFGLLGIRERIEVLGGRVEAGNRPGGGYALTIEVPA